MGNPEKRLLNLIFIKDDPIQWLSKSEEGQSFTVIDT
jgi:hypothetical protein